MYLDYEKSKDFVLKLKFKSKLEWVAFSKSIEFPKFLYKRPDSSFDEFEGYPVFLGYSKTIKKKKNKEAYLSFDNAHKYVLSLRLNSQNDWFIWYRENKLINIPCTPNIFYKKDWIGYSHWLGTDNKKSGIIEYYSYNDCRNIVISKEFKNRKSFYEWILCSDDIRIPRRPDYLYKKSGDWTNWDYFLNVKNPSPKCKSKLFTSYTEAVKYLSDKELKNYNDYVSYIRENKLEFLPLRPDYVYKEEWCGYLPYLSKDTSDKQSYGEYVIEEFLKKYNIVYIKEHMFNTCKSINCLPFDFYIPNMNICIEFDGELHFKSIKIFGGDKTLDRIKKHDIIKNEWCLNNEIELIRISYKQVKDINKLLSEILINVLY